jgi:hypothetical protein
MTTVDKKRAKMYSCLRQTENWSQMESQYKFDKVVFKPEALLKALPTYSPKLVQLFQIINDVDASDLATHGHYFKHFIFSDVKENGAGAKVLAAAFMAKGFTNLITKDSLKATAKLPAVTSKSKNKAFGLLSSAPVYDTEFSQKMKKKVLETFNERPANIHGTNMRFIILDSGFKEGIDLFDVKYVHIFEPSMSIADLKQTVGRATRTCGQKGLQFVPDVGWQLFVYNYFVVVPEVVKLTNYAAKDLDLLPAGKQDPHIFQNANKLADVARLYGKNDAALANLAEQLYKLAPVFSVDFDLTRKIHRINDIQYLYDDKYDDYVNREYSSAKSSSISKTSSFHTAPAQEPFLSKDKSASFHTAPAQEPFLSKDKSPSFHTAPEPEPVVSKEKSSSFHTAPAPEPEPAEEEEEEGKEASDKPFRKRGINLRTLKRVNYNEKRRYTRKNKKSLPVAVGGKSKLCSKPPASRRFLNMVYQRYNHPSTIKLNSSPEFFDQYLHKVPLFCKQVNFEWAKRAARVPFLHQQKKQFKGGKSGSRGKSGSGSISKSNEKVEEKILESLDIVPYSDDAALSKNIDQPVKTDYAIVDYNGTVKEKLKRGKPSPPLTALSFEGLRDFIKSNYGKAFRWNDIVIENKCVVKPAATTTKAVVGGGQVVDLNPTQQFIKTYFTPSSPYKGMLLWHSVGTGKTCSAIATASASFEPANYTILWVTRNTLKSDVYKNMFVDICHQALANRKDLPEDKSVGMPDSTPAEKASKDAAKQQYMAAMKRLLSKQWIEPISYKTFSNMLTPHTNNEYKLRLQAINGTADILKKTLIIIDEAHKLYGGDLSALERPDMGALEKLLQNSYSKSGNQSARLLLMTATPITDSPMELFQLVNLFKEGEKEQIPINLTAFQTTYMNATTNQLTEPGIKKLAGQLCGHISYLNREQDPTQFAQPVMIDVPVMMSTLDSDEQRHVLARGSLLEEEKQDLSNISLPKMKKSIRRTPHPKKGILLNGGQRQKTLKKITSRITQRKVRAILKELKASPTQEARLMTRCLAPLGK